MPARSLLSCSCAGLGEACVLGVPAPWPDNQWGRGLDRPPDWPLVTPDLLGSEIPTFQSPSPVGNFQSNAPDLLLWLYFPSVTKVKRAVAVGCLSMQWRRKKVEGLEVCPGGWWYPSPAGNPVLQPLPAQPGRAWPRWSVGTAPSGVRLRSGLLLPPPVAEMGASADEGC